MHTTVLLRRRLSQSAVILPFLIAACSDSIAPPKAATIEASSSLDEAAFAGLYVATNPEVLVRDENGSPMAGVRVTFAVTTGGGSVTGSTTRSGPQGRAAVDSWKLGSTPGTNTLVAAIDGAGSVEFKVEAVLAPTGRFELITINGQPLPFYDYVTGGTFTLNSDATFIRSEDYREDGEEWSWELFGRFKPHPAGGLSFYTGGTLLADGKVEGDTLTLIIKGAFYPYPHIYVRPHVP